jgi:HisA/HisF family protein
MEVIPVIDVRHGVAVAAVRGDRAAYRPLVTPLSQRSDPLAVAQGLCNLFAFPTLYVADLDGIEGRGENSGLAARIREALPAGSSVWLDAGRRPRDVAQGSNALGHEVPVIGSESLQVGSDVRALGALSPEAYVLSLDFKDGGFAGPAGVLAAPDLWPRRVIVMTLARVGSGEGPDLDRLAEVVRRAEGRAVYAAGGVRDMADLDAVEQVGAAGALIASALHAGTIPAGDLEKIAGR